MIKKVSKLLSQYKSLIAYGFFGVCTTIVNVIAYALCTKKLTLSTVPATVLAWIGAVFFAYVTNRKWVFESEEKSSKGIFREIIYFFGCRLLTGLLDIGFMYFFVDLLRQNDMVIKIVSNIFVIIINYVASKLLIFKRRE